MLRQRQHSLKPSSQSSLAVDAVLRMKAKALHLDANIMIFRTVPWRSRMLLWCAVFGLPAVASTLEWAILIKRRRDQLRHITVIVAMAFSTASALLGLWTLLHFQRMLLVPAGTGLRVVETGCLTATIGVLASFTWVTIERNWASWMALAISVWMFLIWMLGLLSA